MARQINLCIVGMGSRGLTILERCLRFAALPDWSGTQFLVYVIDPHEAGTGAHPTTQPSYCLLNTICGLPTLYPGDIFESPELARPGPSFLDWLKLQGYRLDERGALPTVSKTAGRDFDAHDFAPRSLLGLYLADVFHHLADSATPNVRLIRHAQEAVRVDPGLDGEQVHLANGMVVQADYVFLATGHTPRSPSQHPAQGRLVEAPYPVEISTRDILPGQSVGIQGLGLTAMDLLAALTVGRGGQFLREAGSCRYRASGNEPRLLLFSKSGLPYRPRPCDDDGSFDYVPLLFTADRVARLRRDAPGMLDFEHVLWPLLKQELRMAYHLHKARRQGGRASEAAMRSTLIQALQAGRLERLLETLGVEQGEFKIDEDLWPDPGPHLQTGEHYQRWFADQLLRNQRDAALGFSGHAETFARELLLHLRDVIRVAVNHRGLSPASHEWFAGTFIPLVNRNVIGPQPERNAELHALIEAGVVSMQTGPRPRLSWNEREQCHEAASTMLAKPTHIKLDWLISAQVSSTVIEHSGSALIQHLFRAGRIRRVRQESPLVQGLEIDEAFHPVDAAGHVNQRLFALGPVCEGSTYYNHYVPTHVGASTPFVEAHRAVRTMLQHASQRRSSATASCPEQRKPEAVRLAMGGLA